MTNLRLQDIMLEIPAGRIANTSAVNKFGRTINADNNTATDVWDRANNADNQPIWVAPTQARKHNIASTSSSDTSGGAGARTVRIYGLTSWSTVEEYEDVTLNGTTNVATNKSFVIIHRIKVTSWGATNINVGTITATAVTDNTVTAQIDPSNGQTLMAIYGISSAEAVYMAVYYASAIRGSASFSVETKLLVNDAPNNELTNFKIKSDIGVTSEGSNYVERCFRPYYKIEGPAIIKIQAMSSLDNVDVSAGFDLIKEV